MIDLLSILYEIRLVKSFLEFFIFMKAETRRTNVNQFKKYVYPQKKKNKKKI